MQQLRRHAEVLAALQDPRLQPLGSAGQDDSAHAAVRGAVHQALTPQRLRAWHAALAADVSARLEALPEGQPLELVAALAQPVSLALALQVTGLPPQEAAECAPLARQLFLAAALSHDGRPGAEAGEPALALAQRLAAGQAQGAAGIADVQTFVALSQSLPALLAGAWQVLLDHPAALAALIAAPWALPRATDELMRLGSPARALFREAREDLVIGALGLQRGESVALMLAEANRDPERFPDPERFDPGRDARAALGLGGGPHRCAGAALVRLALEATTQALLAGCAELAWADAQAAAPGRRRWQGGFALSAPAELTVMLRRRPHVTKGI